MDLDIIHKQIRQAFNKDQGGYLSPGQIDLALDRAQIQEFTHLYGDDRKMPMPPVAYGATYKIHIDLQPFKDSLKFSTGNYNESLTPMGSGPTGIVTLPSDFLYLTGMQVENRPVKFISEDELPHRLGSILRGPTVARPIAILSEASTSGHRRIQIFPEQPFNGEVFYLRRPPAPYWQGTIAGRSVTYNQTNSTQMLWNDTAIERIIQRTIALLGETMREDLAITNYQKANQ
jgi:hypothetical protein